MLPPTDCICSTEGYHCLFSFWWPGISWGHYCRESYNSPLLSNGSHSNRYGNQHSSSISIWTPQHNRTSEEKHTSGNRSHFSVSSSVVSMVWLLSVLTRMIKRDHRKGRAQRHTTTIRQLFSSGHFKYGCFTWPNQNRDTFKEKWQSSEREGERERIL